MGEKKSTNLLNLSGFLSTFPMKMSPVAHLEPFTKPFSDFFDFNICFPPSSPHSPMLPGYMAVSLWSWCLWLAACCKLSFLNLILGNDEIYIPSFFTLFIISFPSSLTWVGPSLPRGLTELTNPLQRTGTSGYTQSQSYYVNPINQPTWKVREAPKKSNYQQIGSLV